MIFAALTGFRFQDPLWLLLLLPLAAIIYWRFRRRAERPALIFSNTEVFRGIPKTLTLRLLPFVRGAVALGLALSILALARPQLGREDYRVRAEGISMALCLDRSGSMQAMDFSLDGKRVDRFEVVKKIFHDFVLGNKEFSGRPDDRIALITFGGFVDALCPLTLDHEALSEILSMVKLPEPLVNQHGEFIDLGMLNEEGSTAIGDALVAAVERLLESESKSRIVILLSDGKQNAGAVTAEEAAEVAKTHGIRVYTVGIGSTGMAPLPVYGPDGRKGYSNQPVELDEAALKRIAETTGGEYFNARDAGTLENVCATIDKLEKTAHEDRVFTKYRELYRYFLLPGALLLFAGVILLTTRFKPLPEREII